MLASTSILQSLLPALCPARRACPAGGSGGVGVTRGPYSVKVAPAKERPLGRIVLCVRRVSPTLACHAIRNERGVRVAFPTRQCHSARITCCLVGLRLRLLLLLGALPPSEHPGQHL